MNVNAFSQKDYENEPPSGPEKTNPNKPNLTYPQRGKTEVRRRMSEVSYLTSAFCFLPSVHGPQAPKTVDLCIEKVCKKV